MSEPTYAWEVDEKIAKLEADLSEERAQRRELAAALVRVTEERDRLAEENLAVHIDLAQELHSVDDLRAQLDDAQATASMRAGQLRASRVLLDEAQTSAAEHAKRHAEIIDEQVRERAQLVDALDAARADRAWEAKRANEAARLSAEARDRADDLNGVIDGLREQLDVVERDRLDYDNWALNVLVEHRLTYDPGDLTTPIAAYLRELTAERDRLGDKANQLVQAHDERRAERDEARSEVKRVEELNRVSRRLAREESP